MSGMRIRCVGFLVVAVTFTEHTLTGVGRAALAPLDTRTCVLFSIGSDVDITVGGNIW